MVRLGADGLQAVEGRMELELWEGRDVELLRRRELLQSGS